MKIINPSTAPQNQTLEYSVNPARPSITGDLLLAYVAAGSKVASWTIIAGVVMRVNPAEFALLALVRGTLGLLNYASLGIGSGIIHLVARSRPRRGSGSNPLAGPYSNGLTLAGISGIVATSALVIYAGGFSHFHRLPPGITSPLGLVLGMGIGTIFRLMSDAPAGLLQAEHRIRRDSQCIVAAEACWVILSLIYQFRSPDSPIGLRIGVAYAVSGALLLLLRTVAAGRLAGRLLPDFSQVSRTGILQLVGFGSLFVLSQLADFLYAPTDFILINRLLDPNLVAVYAPAVQIDAGLLLLVAGLSNVLLPRAANAFHAGDPSAVRRYYVRGTLASLLLLTIAAGVVLAIAPTLLRLWLGSDQPETRAILPLILIHTVVGGSGAVGRAVLLGIGKVRTYALSVIIGGISNVVLSFLFVWWFGWGLKGIVLGTIAAVTWRCAIWQPIFVHRQTRLCTPQINSSSPQMNPDAHR